MSSENFTSLSSGGREESRRSQPDLGPPSTCFDHPLLSPAGFVEHFRSSVPPAALLPEEMVDACGGSTPLLGVEVPKLCDYLGPFQVLAGAVVTAYAIVAGQLESLPATLLVPKELEANEQDLSFQAFAEVAGNVLSITSQLQVRLRSIIN